ncbi:MAG: lysine--tRNA ligase [Victivallales bacterium]|nr:lysine--tRNA ligase [Victivallales bacterium]
MSEEQQAPVAGENSLENMNMREQRLAKVERLKNAGKNPYGHRVDGIVDSVSAKAKYVDEEHEVTVRVAGRLVSKRIMGKSSFAHILDQEGKIQLYFQKNVVGDDEYAEFKDLDIGDILTADGTLFQTRTGEISVRVTRFELLAKSLRPLPEKFHGLTDTEQRYRQRYLDLISNEEVRKTFFLRSKIIAEIRNYLNSRGYVEVETPMMQPLAGGAAACPFTTHYNALNATMYLRIATELYLKRLVVGGFEKVYEIGRQFRNEGMDRKHNPEFTSMEIYTAYSDCRGTMDLIESLITHVATTLFGTLKFQHGDRTIDLTGPWRRVAYMDLIREKMGSDWYELPIEQQREKARALGLYIPDEMDSLHITHEIYDKTIEDTLIAPTFVTRLPAYLVPLAKRCEDDPSLVDVYELEINAQEISPGYSELNDPIEQRSRFDQQLIGRGDVDGEVDRIDEDFLTAMEHGMPPMGGLGIGIDRLVMLLTGAESIRDVILFPQMKLEKQQGTAPKADEEKA